MTWNRVMVIRGCDLSVQGGDLRGWAGPSPVLARGGPRVPGPRPHSRAWESGATTSGAGSSAWPAGRGCFITACRTLMKVSEGVAVGGRGDGAGLSPSATEGPRPARRPQATPPVIDEGAAELLVGLRLGRVRRGVRSRRLGGRGRGRSGGVGGIRSSVGGGTLAAAACSHIGWWRCACAAAIRSSSSATSPEPQGKHRPRLIPTCGAGPFRPVRGVDWIRR